MECRKLYEGDQDMTEEDIEVELGDIRYVRVTLFYECLLQQPNSASYTGSRH